LLSAACLHGLCDVCWCFDRWCWLVSEIQERVARYCTKTSHPGRVKFLLHLFLGLVRAMHYSLCFSDWNGRFSIFSSYPPSTCMLYAWQYVFVSFSFHVSPLRSGVYGISYEKCPT
jgi:hypothetical protein